MTIEYCCPICGEVEEHWFHGQRTLKDHLLDAHNMRKRVKSNDK